MAGWLWVGLEFCLGALEMFISTQDRGTDLHDHHHLCDYGVSCR